MSTDSATARATASPSRCHPTSQQRHRGGDGPPLAPPRRAARSSRRRSSAADCRRRRCPGWRPGRRPASCRGEPFALLVVASRSSRACGSTSAAGFTVPTQLLFVPMLFLLPAQIVPLAVAAGLRPGGRSRRGRAASAGRAARHAPRRLLVQPRARRAAHRSTAAPAPASPTGGSTSPRSARSSPSTSRVLGAGRAPRRRAVAARAVRRGALGLHRRRPAVVGRPARRVRRRGAAGAALLVLPLAALISMFAAERRTRLDHVIELSQAYRGTALVLGDVVEADDAYTGDHTQGVVALALEVADRHGPRRDRAPAGRVRRPAPRRGQDRDPEGDHQQARAARRRRVGADPHPHGRGSAPARPRRRAHARRGPRRPRLARALGRRRLPRRARRRRDPARGADRRRAATRSTR